MAFKFPYTNFQMINLDWIMKTLNQLKDAIPLVQQASTIYNQSLETLAAANEAVETVTEQAAEAVSTANTAQATAGQANTTAAEANSRAATAETNATAAQNNALTALSTAQGAASAASAAQGSANSALSASHWTYKSWIYTVSGQNTVTLDMTGANTVLLFAFDSPGTSYGKEIFTREIPLAMFDNKQGGAEDGDVFGYEWTIHNSCTMRVTKSGNNMTFIYATTPATGASNIYCHIFVR